ncbi:c6.1 [Tranosema rostrale ichnovirus]|nr:c6.1 [Tranosema rostrale ichnovirus]
MELEARPQLASVDFEVLTMASELSGLRVLLKVHSISIDNDFFRLHYKLTVIMLLVTSLVIMARQFLKNPMDCYFPDLPGTSYNTYCYIHLKFLVERSDTREVGEKLLDSGVSGITTEDESKICSYDQWVLIALFVQAILFYIPHYLWKTWEGGRMKILAIEPVIRVQKKNRVKEYSGPLVEYFCSQLHSHNNYAYKYFTCELLNLINVVGQIYLMNAFIAKDFLYDEIYKMIFNQRLNETMTNPMEQVFPTIAKCTYREYGSSGTLEEYTNGICVLTQNSMNQKIFVLLWFWCHVLAAISALIVIFRIVTLLFPSIRFYGFRSNNMNTARYSQVIFHKLQIGDWFLLKMLQQNISSVAYDELICGMAQRFNPDLSE